MARKSFWVSERLRARFSIFPPPAWGDHGQKDKTNIHLYRPDGTKVTYQQLEAEAGDKFKDIVSIPTFTKVSEAVQKDVQRIADDLAKAKPDLLVVIADDQYELFDKSNVPAIAIYRGTELLNDPEEGLPPGALQWMKDRRAAWTIDPDRHYPGEPAFANELIERLIDKEFDITAVDKPSNPQKGIGHAWAFVANRLAGDRTIPIVPLILNTWYPPNVPTAARCYKLGQALRAAIEESPRDMRVAIVTAGGMSHLVLNEKLDRQFMAALQASDVETLTHLPPEALIGGTGQLKDWIVLAGAAEKLKHQWSDYWPGYRTPGGTGCGLAFTSWS